MTTMTSITQRVFALAAIVLVPSAFAASASVNQLAMEKEGVQLIGQVEEVARDVRYNADRLAILKTSPAVSRWTHVHHLEQIKSLINEGLRPAMERLAEIQPRFPEWKQDSIDKMLEAARALAADTNDAILAKNDAGAVPAPLNPEYRSLIDRVHKHADALVTTADAAGAYASARMKAGQAGLRLPPQP
jgi:hypothetical protein